MSRRLIPPTLLLTALCASLGAAQNGRMIGAPDAVPTHVASDGALLTDFGPVGLRLTADGRDAKITQTEAAFPGYPLACTTLRSPGVEAVISAYRAPMWTGSVDVMEVELTNATARQQETELALVVPEGVSYGEEVGTVAGRVVLGLPQGLTPARKARDWGCATGAPRLPGWARPNRPCDSAFANIRAGMGGIPIIYQLQVDSGSSHQVALGLCESHWASPNLRPVTYFVEGGLRETIDCVAAFGQHGPGVLISEARDTNGDGMLRIVAAPGEGASDRNPILNVIWVFPPNEYLDPEEVISGKMTPAATHYVDVGGGSDQDLYEGGDLRYELSLAPNETRTLTFLVAAAGAAISRPEDLTIERLRHAAVGVWEGFMAGLDGDLSGDAEALNALAFLAVSQAQANDFYLALSAPGGEFDLVNHTAVAIALDHCGLHEPAERLLRLLWDSDAPEPVRAHALTAQGSYASAPDDGVAEAVALYALAHHAAVTVDPYFARRAWPAMQAVAARVGGRVAVEGSVGVWSRVALAELAKAAAVAGESVDESTEAPAPPFEALGDSPTLSAARLLLARAT